MDNAIHYLESSHPSLLGNETHGFDAPAGFSYNSLPLSEVLSDIEGCLDINERLSEDYFVSRRAAFAVFRDILDIKKHGHEQRTIIALSCMIVGIESVRMKSNASIGFLANVNRFADRDIHFKGMLTNLKALNHNCQLLMEEIEVLRLQQYRFVKRINEAVSSWQQENNGFLFLD